MVIAKKAAQLDRVLRVGLDVLAEVRRSNLLLPLEQELDVRGEWDPGALQRVEVGLGSKPPCGPQPTQPVPAGFDYDRWLGPAPWAPYTAKRCHWNFRWILDYSGGQLTDWGAHFIDVAHWGMGTERTGPVEVHGTGNFPGLGTL